MVAQFSGGAVAWRAYGPVFDCQSLSSKNKQIDSGAGKSCEEYSIVFNSSSTSFAVLFILFLFRKTSFK